MDRRRILKRLEQIGDFVVAHQLPTGELDIEHGTFIYPAGYNMRALAAIYKLTGRQEYLEAVLRWTDRVFSVQNADGSFYADTVALEECYGRFVSDAANGLNVVFNILPYLDEPRRETYLRGLKRFAEWVLGGEEGTPFVLPDGAIGCGVYKGDEKNLQGRGRQECLECTAIALCTFLAPWYRLSADARCLRAAVKAVEYILDKQNADGTYDYISKGTRVQIADRPGLIVHVLHYVTEGLVYFLEFSGIEFFDPLAARARQALKRSVQWLIANQSDTGLWAPFEAGDNNAAKNAALVMPLAWFVEMAGQEESFRQTVPRAQESLARAGEFLLSDRAVSEYGVMQKVRENAFGAIALAEAIQPGISLDMVVPDALTPSADEAEVLPEEILAALPQAESAFDGVEGWIQDGRQAQVVFWRSRDGAECPQHAHPYPEWCVVLAGHTEVTMCGKTRTYRAGDTLFIPAGEPHRSTMSPGYRSLDVFASPGHIKARR